MCREPVDFFVELPLSNESIPPPGSLFQQKVIARLSLRLSLNWNNLMIKKGQERGT